MNYLVNISILDLDILCYYSDLFCGLISIWILFTPYWINIGFNYIIISTLIYLGWFWNWIKYFKTSWLNEDRIQSKSLEPLPSVFICQSDFYLLPSKLSKYFPCSLFLTSPPALVIRFKSHLFALVLVVHSSFSLVFSYYFSISHIMFLHVACWIYTVIYFMLHAKIMLSFVWCFIIINIMCSVHWVWLYVLR